MSKAIKLPLALLHLLMLKIVFPPYEFKIKKENAKDLIWDEIRKKWITLTPEEWVRQNFIQYLIQTKNIPAALIAIEKRIQLGELKKRCDIVIYKSGIPWMIVECKELNVHLSEAVLEQIIRYNMALPVEYLVITNGSYSYGWQIIEQEISSLLQLPDWNT